MSDINIGVRETDCEVGNLVELAKRLQHTGLQNTITLFDKNRAFYSFQSSFLNHPFRSAYLCK